MSKTNIGASLHAPPTGGRNAAKVSARLVLLQKVHNGGEEHRAGDEEHRQHA